MSALQTIRKFRLHEIKGISNNITRFHPLQSSGRPSESDIRGTLTLPNPFLPRRNPKTGKWSAPKYSLRRQAELVKKARESNTLHLLPPGPKFYRPGILATAKSKPTFTADESDHGKRGCEEAFVGPIVWEGKFEEKIVAGADVGTRLYASKKRMFKGHKWERVREARNKKRKILMRDMLRRVNTYKTYHKARRPNPLKPARSVKAPKLPF